MKGGYAQVDFKGVSIVGTPKKIEGVYDAISNAISYNKPILATNIVVEDVKYAPVFISVIDGGVNEVFNLISTDGKTIHRVIVTNSDMVSEITNNIVTE